MKKILYLLVLIISLIIINSLLRSIFNLWQKHDLISDAEQQLQKEKLENEKLQDQLARVKRVDFIEEEARNKLFMVKPGEKIVLVERGSAVEQGSEIQKKSSNIPIWKQWWNLFFVQS